MRSFLCTFLLMAYSVSGALVDYFWFANTTYGDCDPAWDGTDDIPVNKWYPACQTLQGLAAMFQSENWNVDAACKFSPSNPVTNANVETLSSTCLSGIMTTEVEVDFEIVLISNFEASSIGPVFNEANYMTATDANGYNDGILGGNLFYNIPITINASDVYPLALTSCLNSMCDRSGGIGGTVNVTCDFNDSGCDGSGCTSCGTVEMTLSPTTSSPTTGTPTTGTPTTSAPSTNAPSGSAPSTNAPSTRAPSNQDSTGTPTTPSSANGITVCSFLLALIFSSINFMF